MNSPSDPDEPTIVPEATVTISGPSITTTDGHQSGAGPVAPGIAVRYTDKKLQRRHMWGILFVTVAFTAIWTAGPGIMLPNQVQLIEFGHFFAGHDAGVDLQKLTELRDAVAAGTKVATADQHRLLGLLSQFESARAAGLALVTSIATLVTLFTAPLLGEFSDRTRSRLGRRAPWMLYGAIVGAVGLVLLPLAPSVAVVVVLWALINVATTAANTPLTATIVDREPDSRVGASSSMAGLGNFAGGIIGSVAAGALFASIGLSFYYILAVGLVVAVVVFVLRLRDRSSKDLVVAPFRVGAFLRGFLIPMKAPDFRWVWISRVLLLFGYGVSTALSLYMMQSYIHPALSAAQATSIAPLLGVVGLPLTIAALIVSGRLSDRLGRRKPFVIAAALLMAASMAVPLLSPTLPALFVQAVMGSLAFGIFIPVDQALFVAVLPSRFSAGRDLGIANTATNLGQALAPIVAAQVVVITAGYAGVWLVALVLVALAAVSILRVKTAR